jgi:hypothetical protein
MQAERTTPERKWVLTKVGPGDYLLPSNDAQTLWRLRSYEDGPSHGLDVNWSRDRTFWELWRWKGRIDEHEEIAESLDEGRWSDRWEHVESSLASRREAIDAALRLGAA